MLTGDALLEKVKELCHTEPTKLVDDYVNFIMDYETYIDIKQYSTDCYFSYTLKVIDVMNMDYYYSGTAKTLDDVMDCIKLHLKQHQN
jgi:hypothetical protein